MSLLPTELVLLIIGIAATRDRRTAATLRLVSRWVQDEVEPIFYRVITLREVWSTRGMALLSSPKYIAHTQCVGFEFALKRTELLALQANLKIRNIIASADQHLSVLQKCFPGLQELHMFGLAILPQPTAPLPHLRRLHFDVWASPPIHTILDHPNLTHIALSVVDNARKGPAIERTVVDLLAKHRPLIILLVRLCHGNKPRTAHGHQSAEAILTSIKDRRLVVTHVDAYERRNIVDEWERNVRSGESIWDIAEAELDASTSGASPGPC